MKFYEVQPALEAGKKITHHNLRGKFISIEKEEANIFGKTLVLTISDHSREIGYSLDMFDLFADDWEIVEDILECKLFRSKEIRYTCPKCEREHEQLVYPEDRSETIHECHHCGQKFRFSNLEEMKKMYYDTESKIEDYTPILIDFVKNPPDIITLNNNGSIVTYSRSNSTKGTK